jgi:polysaccharide biosynthesis protein PslL
MESLQPSQRIAYIDIAKGIGILLVVLGHSDLALVSPYLHQIIYSFHIPLFFFLSGIFFNPRIAPGLYLKKRFRSILQPYLFVIFLIFLASISFTNMGIDTALVRFAKSLYASTLYIWWIPLWFLPSLFVTSLFAYIIYHVFLLKTENRYLRWTVLLVILAGGVFFIDAFYPFTVTLFGKVYELYGLPYSLDIVLVSGFFYMLGAEVRRLPPDNIFDNTWVLLLAGTCLLALNAIFNQRTDLAVRIFDSFPLNTTEALLGIAFTLAVSKQIASTNTRFASILAYIGQASLFILIFHAPIQEYWGAKIYALTDMPAISILFAYIISTGISIGIYKIFLESNPRALFWFGRKSSPFRKQENVAELPGNIKEEKLQEHGEP